jgi:hypothetical protein
MAARRNTTGRSSTSFKNGEDPDLIIVVDKLLTGFDAPRNVVLYIARNLKEHNLLQAIARVNRLYPGKDYGYIIDYYGVVTQLHDALELYSSLGGKFDPEDLEGTLTDVNEELKKLPALHDAVWDLFKEVTNKKDEEAFELALEEKDVRDDFYTRLSRFTRVLKMALSSIHWITRPRRKRSSATSRRRLLPKAAGQREDPLRRGDRLPRLREADPEDAEHLRPGRRGHPDRGTGEHLRARSLPSRGGAGPKHPGQSRHHRQPDQEDDHREDG